MCYSFYHSFCLHHFLKHEKVLNGQRGWEEEGKWKKRYVGVGFEKTDGIDIG